MGGAVLLLTGKGRMEEEDRLNSCKGDRCFWLMDDGVRVPPLASIDLERSRRMEGWESTE